MQFSRRRFLTGAAAVGAMVGLGAKPRERKKQTMSFQLVEKAASATAGGNINASVSAIAVPTGEVWEIKSIYAQFTASVTVGNRVYAVNLDQAVGASSSYTLHALHAPAVATASQCIEIQSAAAVATVTYTHLTGINNHYRIPFPHTAIAGGASSYIYGWDTANISRNTDVITLIVGFDRYRYVTDSAPVAITQPLSVPNPFA